MSKFEDINEGKPKNDEYYTPDTALQPLLKYIPKGWTIWEPTATVSNIVDFFDRHNYNCVWSKDDFLKYKEPPKGADILVTNPPYSKKTKFIGQSYKLGIPFCLLLPITALEGYTRQKLYNKYGIQLILLNKRIEFIPNKRGAWFAVAWFCHGLNLQQDIIFEDIEVMENDHENNK